MRLVKAFRRFSWGVAQHACQFGLLDNNSIQQSVAFRQIGDVSTTQREQQTFVGTLTTIRCFRQIFRRVVDLWKTSGLDFPSAFCFPSRLTKKQRSDKMATVVYSSIACGCIVKQNNSLRVELRKSWDLNKWVQDFQARLKFNWSSKLLKYFSRPGTGGLPRDQIHLGPPREPAQPRIILMQVSLKTANIFGIRGMRDVDKRKISQVGSNNS